MSNLKILSWTSVEKLKDDVKNSTSARDLYCSSEDRLNTEELHFLSTTIQVEDTPPLLETETRAGKDAENAILVYEYLGRLSRTQASDQRLWVTLCHTTFWDYCKKRWPQATSQNYILEHWFEKSGGGLGALRRNAISRLWWAAHLTLAPWENDPELEIFRSPDRTMYTKILLSQAQIFQDVLERKLGSNERFRICLLHSLNQFLPHVTNKDDLSKSVSVRLNLLLKHRQLDAMSVPEMQILLSEVVKSSAEALQ